MTRLEQIVKRAKQLKKTAPASTKWTDLIKKASKQVTPVRATASNKATATRNLGLSGVKKRATKSGSHKDTRSHNVNIRVVSGVPDNYSFSFGNAELYTQKQFTIFGKVELIVFEPISKKTITVLDGKNTTTATKQLLAFIITKQKSTYYDLDTWEKKLKKLVTELNKEITKYNKDIKAPKKAVVKKATVKRAPAKKSVKKAPVKKTRAQESEAIRSKVRKDGFIMPHGYAVKKATRVSGFVGRVVIKKFTLTELKKLNPNFFSKKIDEHFGIYKRKLMISPKLDTQVLIEATRQKYGNDIFRSYTVRKISPAGEILQSNRFNTLLEASNYIGKNIIL
jgi:hypothetical protein